MAALAAVSADSLPDAADAEKGQEIVVVAVAASDLLPARADPLQQEGTAHGEVEGQLAVERDLPGAAGLMGDGDGMPILCPEAYLAAEGVIVGRQAIEHVGQPGLGGNRMGGDRRRHRAGGDRQLGRSRPAGQLSHDGQHIAQALGMRPGVALAFVVRKCRYLCHGQYPWIDCVECGGDGGVAAVIGAHQGSEVRVLVEHAGIDRRAAVLLGASAERS